MSGVLFRVAVAELEAWDADYAEDRYYRSPVLVLLLAAAATATTSAAVDLPMVSAEVYLPDPLEGPFVPAANYVELMVAGAREHGLNDYADRLEDVAKQAAAAAADATAAAPEVDGLETNLPSVVAELSDVFERYELALDANDVEGLDSFFWRSPHTTRLAGGASYSTTSQHGYGFDAIHRHRTATAANGISGSSKGERVRVVVTTLGERFGTIMYEYLVRGNSECTGRQSQTFV